MDGISDFLKDIGEYGINLEEYSGDNDIEDASDNLKKALNQGMTFAEIKKKIMPKRSKAAIRAYAYHLGLVKNNKG